MRFVKMHGLGNDFILINALQEKLPGDLPGLARRACDRRFGIGADGLILLLPSTRADVRMRIINADGSEAEMCGNGIRCLAKYAYESGIVPKTEMTVETLAGLILPRLIIKGGRVEAVQVDMGQPRFEREALPMSGTGHPVIEEPITVDGKEWRITCLSMGNPHCVIFVPEVAKEQVQVVGPLLEKHPLFPRGVNVEFVELRSRRELVMRVWERGAGETLACGTGACAAAVAAALTGRTGREVKVHLPGGYLEINWLPDGRVLMTGPAETVFSGEYLVDVGIKED
ncbi:MAG: diaminopimelate epimerase [Clostridia bacterium]|nr:diaminopimelate epimerase [Clostridia bacterium]